MRNHTSYKKLSPKELRFWLVSPVMGALVALGSSSAAQSQTSVISEDLTQTAYRIRADVDAGLNANTGWASWLDTPTTVQADQPFRIRFEVETKAKVAEDHQFQLQYRYNNGAWEPLLAEDHPYPVKELEIEYEEQPDGPLGDQWDFVQGDASALSWHGDGFLRVTAGGSPVLAQAVYTTFWDASEFAADMRLAQSQQAAIVFGYEDAANHYRLNVVGGGDITIVRIDEGLESVLATYNVGVVTDEWIGIEIEMDGSEVEVEYEWDGGAFETDEDLGANIPASNLAIYLPANSTADFEAFGVAGEATSPRTSIISSEQFDYGDPTQDILQVSTRPFSGGAGIDYYPITPVWSAPSKTHSEWEFPIVIRSFFDGPSQNEDGDTFEYRLVDADGEIVKGNKNAYVTLEVPEQHLGGVFAETPMRVGPWEASNGDLYFLMEPAETDNDLMSVKSSDGGDSWSEVGGAGRPDTGDMEGVGQVHVGNQIHTLHQTSDEVVYHVFNTSDHPTQPDTWVITDEELATPVEPPVQVADLEVRSDGSVVGVYGSGTKIAFRVRSPQGVWSAETTVDPGVAGNVSGPTLALGNNDVVHLAYTGPDGTAWYRQILPNGTLTPRQQVASGLGTDVEEAGSILPLVYLPQSNTLSIIYRLANGELWERQVDSAGQLSSAVQVTSRSVIVNAADSEQAGADAVGYGSSVHVLFIEEDTGRIFHTYREYNTWSEPTLEIDGVDALWVRGNVIKQNQGAVYGYVYDAGSGGGSGMNEYAEIYLPAL